MYTISINIRLPQKKGYVEINAWTRGALMVIYNNNKKELSKTNFGHIINSYNKNLTMVWLCFKLLFIKYF